MPRKKENMEEIKAEEANISLVAMEEEESQEEPRKMKAEKSAVEEDSDASEETASEKTLQEGEDAESAKKKGRKKESKVDALKEQLKAKKDVKTLLSLEEYVKSGIHLGTKVIMPDMRKYVYRRRADGLAILNTELIDAKLKEAAEYITKFNPKDIIVVCKREAGWKAAKLFSEITSIRAFTKKYPAGIITNIKLANFFEPELVLVCDPWLDKNAMNDAKITNKKILALCDTNNITKRADIIVPCNNKSEKSLGLVFYIFAKELVKFHKMDKKIKLEDFTGDLGEKRELKEKETNEPIIVNPEAQAF